MPTRSFTKLALCLAVLPLVGWWLTGLTDLDEGFYAAVVAEMNRRGEWITPYYNGHPWFEKPILLYWLAKPTVAVFGEMVGPRLPSVLSAIGCYLLVAGYARRRLSESAATWSVMVLASSLMFVAYGRLMMTDLALTLSFTAAMLTFWESLVGNPKWRIATAALLGVAALAKGPVALAFFLIIAGWTYFREVPLRASFRGYWLLGLIALGVVAGSWYGLAYRANGQTFVEKFLIEQNINRFKGGDDAHTIKEFWAYLMYLPILFLGMFPWSIWMGKAWPRRTVEFDEGTAFKRYLCTWGLTILVFFTVAGAKLPHYVLPVVPPMAMLLGAYFGERWKELTMRRFMLPTVWLLFVAILINGAFLFHYAASGQMEAHWFARKIRQELLPKGGAVALFQLGKLDKNKGTGELRLKPTSLPSMLFYLNTTAHETKEPSEVAVSGDRWLFTRKGRITNAVVDDFRAHGCSLKLVQDGENFELYEVEPNGAISSPPAFGK